MRKALLPPTRAPLLGGPLPVELMNTLWADREGVHDALSTDAEVESWLAAVDDRVLVDNSGGASPEAESSSAAAQAAGTDLRTLRDALRRLAAEATGDTRPAATSPIGSRQAAVEALNRACTLAPAWSELAWVDGGEPRLVVRSQHGPDLLAVCLIATQAVDLFAGTGRTQLRACHAPGCVLYFTRDHPRQQWCSAGCGNRARVARHYQRHRAAGSPAAAAPPWH